MSVHEQRVINGTLAKRVDKALWAIRLSASQNRFDEALGLLDEIRPMLKSLNDGKEPVARGEGQK